MYSKAGPVQIVTFQLNRKVCKCIFY